MRNAIISRAAWLKTRPFIIGVAGLLMLGFLYLSRLASPALLSSREIEHLSAYSTSLNSVAIVRLPSALTAILSVVLLYKLVRRWHGANIGVMAATLFATSAWMLHTGHAANGLIPFSLVPLILFLHSSWFAGSKHSGNALLGLAAVSGLVLLIPGAIWFLLAMLLLLRKAIVQHVRKATAGQRLAAGVIGAVFLGGVILHLVTADAPVSRWFGLLDTAPTIMQFIEQWLHSATFLVKGPEAPDLWLAHQPLLDMFSLFCLLLGIYIYARHWRNLRVHMLLTFGIIASLLVGLNGMLAINYLLPIIYLIIGTGLTEILHEWYVIFPRNPVARSVGTTVVSVAVLVAASYHITAYFIAWPKVPATQASYSRPLP